jgi:hypothetical protein
VSHSVRVSQTLCNHLLARAELSHRHIVAARTAAPIPIPAARFPSLGAASRWLTLKQNNSKASKAAAQSELRQISLWRYRARRFSETEAEEEEDRGQGLGTHAVKSPDCLAVEDVDDDGFSFPVPPLHADKCIAAVYPIFGRPAASSPALAEHEDEPETATLRVPLGRLLLEEREFRARQQDGRSRSARRSLQQEEVDDEAIAGADEDLEGVPPETYCLWAPGGEQPSASPRRCRKSGSKGSVLRWGRISDSLAGRSYSDGKQKFVLFNASTARATPLPPPIGSKDKPEGAGVGVSRRGDAAAGPCWSLMYYGRGGGGAGRSRRRRSYLPYKQELVGLFVREPVSLPYGPFRSVAATRGCVRARPTPPATGGSVPYGRQTLLVRQRQLAAPELSPVLTTTRRPYGPLLACFLSFNAYQWLLQLYTTLSVLYQSYRAEINLSGLSE